MIVFDRPRAPLVIVLPHSEAFQADGAGAISICVRDAAVASGLGARIKILGKAVERPFDEARFMPVTLASWIYGRRGVRYVRGVIRVLRELAPAYIEIHNRPTYVTALREAFPTTPIVLYIHNDPRTIRGIRKVRERGRCLESVSAVVCVSEYIRRCMLDALEYHPHAGKVRVVLNGVDTTNFVPAEVKQREIIFVGRLSPQKGGLIFAEAACFLKDRLPDWRFIMIGARSFTQANLGSDYERQVVETMRRVGPQGEITGYVTQAEVRERFSRAAIAVVPSQWDEPLGLVVLEAMSSGCAVVASRRGGIPEIVGDAGILIGESDARGWGERLLNLANDSEQLDYYQCAARGRAVQSLDIHRAVMQLDEIRRDIISETRE